VTLKTVEQKTWKIVWSTNPTNVLIPKTSAYFELANLFLKKN